MSAWPRQPIASLGTVTTGSTPRTSEEHFYGGDIPFVTPAELDQIDPIMNAARTLSESGSQEARLLPEGTVMVCCIGSLGKVGIAGRTVASNQQINSVIFDPRLIWSRYGFYACRLLKSRLQTLAPATTVAIVNKSKFEQLEIPVPPLPEQRRIAEILDRAEALRVKRRAALAQLDELIKSIFFDIFGDPITNPKRWPRAPFTNLLTNIDSGWSPVCLDRPVEDEEWGVLKLGAVTWCEYNPSENKALPDNLDPDPNLEVKPGDLLFTRKNTYELVAACALVQDTPPRLMMSDLIFRLRLRHDAGIDPNYLHQLLIYPTKRREIQKLAGGSASSMPNISKAKLNTAQIEIPPLTLQQEFAYRISAVEKLKKTHEASLAELDSLFASLQYRAFRGEL
jgi:type I restriction enzyme S subunit